MADVHYHSGPTWWALLMINDEKIILGKCHFLPGGGGGGGLLESFQVL